ncbi:MAG: hypothetical protein ACM34H_07445 [Deltaproteobacteria bacterium]
MKRYLLITLVTLTAVLCGVSLCLGAEVAQGKCVKVEKDGTLVTIEEYDTQFSKEHPYGRPTGKTSVYDFSKAEMGVPAAVGDILRVAYTVKGNEKTAVKVMNVSRQDLMKK